MKRPDKDIPVTLAEDLRIIYKHNKPYGIRNKGGFLFFFIKISKFPNQEERYRKEVEEQYKLADYLLEQISNFI